MYGGLHRSGFGGGGGCIPVGFGAVGAAAEWVGDGSTDTAAIGVGAGTGGIDAFGATTDAEGAVSTGLVAIDVDGAVRKSRKTTTPSKSSATTTAIFPYGVGRNGSAISTDEETGCGPVRSRRDAGATGCAIGRRGEPSYCCFHFTDEI